MKIALISPKSSFYFRDEEKNSLLKNLEGFSYHPTFWSGLGSAFPILASLTPSDIEICILDENIEPVNFDESYDLVGITAMTHQALRAYQISREFQKKNVHTVLGGLHATYETEEARYYFDTVVTGEAENIWPKLIEDFQNKSIKPLYRSVDYPPVDIKNLPIPRYDLLRHKNYKILWLNTSRGCPYDCEFCSGTEFYGRKIRNKAIDTIIEEVKLIKKLFPRIMIGFGNDNMFVDRKYSYELLEKFIDLNFSWHTQTDISIAEDDKLLKLLYQSGCEMVFIGFESLDQVNLNNIYDKTVPLKSRYLARYSEMIEKIHKSGIGIWASFIAGLDEDDPSVFDRIIHFAQDNHLMGVYLTILTPLPGTRLRQRLFKEKRLLPTSWDNYTFSDINFIPKNMTFRQLEEGVLRTFSEIFSRENRIETVRYFKEIHRNLIRNGGDPG